MPVVHHPSSDQFAELAQQARFVPVFRQLTADTLTPVTAYQRLSDGDWSFAAAVWSLYEDVMIVLKTGNTGPPDNIFWAAYLLDNSVEPTSGRWSTGDGINGSGKDISHITLYARGTPGDTDMPEPSTALLMLLVLGGLSLRQRMLMANVRR